jgi:hypothetical protein
MVPKRSRVTTSSGAFSIATVHQLREELSGESEFVFFTALTPAFPAQGGGSLLPDDAPVGVVAAEAQKRVQGEPGALPGWTAHTHRAQLAAADQPVDRPRGDPGLDRDLAARPRNPGLA